METTDQIRFTRAQLIEEWEIKEQAYYDRLKYLGIKSKKDENKKAYLEEPEVNRLRALHEWIQGTGAMKGFLDHEREQQQDWDDSDEEASEESTEQAGELAVSNGEKIAIAQNSNYPNNDEEIAAATSGQRTERKTLQKFDRLAQTSAAAALLEAREILAGEYIADPNKLDPDLQEQVFFEERVPALNRALVGKRLAEAIKAQRNRNS